MPLQPLADAIIFLNEKRETTPVIVTPSCLSLRCDFFLQLIETLAERTSRPIGIDWYRTPSLIGMLGNRLASRAVGRMNHALATDSNLSNKVCFRITASIQRPGESRRDLIVALSDDRQELPRWAAAIRFAGT